MTKKSILSRQLVRVKVAKLDSSIRKLEREAGFYENYIHRVLDSDKVTLATINKIAAALDCAACDLIEEIEIEDSTDGWGPAPVTLPLMSYA